MITKLITHAQARLSTFRRDESGATIVEYGVALLIVIAIGLGVFGTIGGSLNKIFGAVNTALSSATGSL
jgi:pilus assembly protein Flp/PilA